MGMALKWVRVCITSVDTCLNDVGDTTTNSTDSTMYHTYAASARDTYRRRCQLRCMKIPWAVDKKAKMFSLVSCLGARNASQ